MQRKPEGATADSGLVKRRADCSAIVDQNVGPLPDLARLIERSEFQARLIGETLGIADGDRRDAGPGL